MKLKNFSKKEWIIFSFLILVLVASWWVIEVKAQAVDITNDFNFGATGGSGGKRIQNLPNPSDPWDAAPKNYVDTHDFQKIEGGIHYSAGNVGIGTTVPGYSLEVNGSINIKDGDTNYYRYGGAKALKLLKDASNVYTNTIVGSAAGNDSITQAGPVASNQTVVGYMAGNSTTDNSDYQTAVGYMAGRGNSGESQTAVGQEAGYSNSGANQIAIGYQAGYSNTGESQTAVGNWAGSDNFGVSQVAVGNWAGSGNIGGSQVAIGNFAGFLNEGESQTAIGYSAGSDNTGNYQVVLGNYAGYLNTGRYQTAIGYSAGSENTGIYQTAVGYMAGGNGNSKISQAALGYQAGSQNQGDYQTAIGHEAGYGNTGVSQAALGYRAGHSNIGESQTAVGQEAGYGNKGINQTALGYQAGYRNSDGDPNEGVYQTAIGYRAGYMNRGFNQTTLGDEAGYENTGNYQTAVGHLAGWGNNSGTAQVAIGNRAGYENTGNYQITIGYGAGYKNIKAHQTALGYGTGTYNSGIYQTALGSLAGFLNIADYQTAIGYKAGQYNEGIQNTAIGSGAFNNFNEDSSKAITFSSANASISGYDITFTNPHNLETTDEDGYINLKYTATNPIDGLRNGYIYRFRIVGTNTIRLDSANLYHYENLSSIVNNYTQQSKALSEQLPADLGDSIPSGTHILTPQFVYTNSIALGYNSEPDASNQVVLGNTATTQVKTAGAIYSTSTEDNYFAGNIITEGEVSARGNVKTKDELVIIDNNGRSWEIYVNVTDNKLMLRDPSDNYYSFNVTLEGSGTPY